MIPVAKVIRHMALLGAAYPVQGPPVLRPQAPRRMRDETRNEAIDREAAKVHVGASPLSMPAQMELLRRIMTAGAQRTGGMTAIVRSPDGWMVVDRGARQGSMLDFDPWAPLCRLIRRGEVKRLGAGVFVLAEQPG